jgi:secretion/DNA translocation related TadE-like protein
MTTTLTRRPRRPTALQQDRGSGSVLVVGLAAAMLLVLTMLLVLAGVLVAGAQARTAADLAALAGAGRLLEGAPDRVACAEAGRVAGANGGRLLECRAAPGAEGAPQLTVVVAVDPAVPGVPLAAVRARAGGVVEDRTAGGTRRGHAAGRDTEGA